MRERTSILLSLYIEERNAARHSESQRSTLTNLVITISTAMLGFIGYRSFSITVLPLAVFLVILGTYGAVASRKLYERYKFHSTRGTFFRDAIASEQPDYQITEFKMAADAEHEKEFPWFYKRIRLNMLWLILHLLIVVLGILCGGVIVNLYLSRGSVDIAL